jgi:hypothetical protein
VLEFGEDLLDRVQVGEVFGQEEKLGSYGANELTYGFASMAIEIVMTTMSPERSKLFASPSARFSGSSRPKNAQATW